MKQLKHFFDAFWIYDWQLFHLIWAALKVFLGYEFLLNGTSDVFIVLKKCFFWLSSVFWLGFIEANSDKNRTVESTKSQVIESEDVTLCSFSFGGKVWVQMQFISAWKYCMNS